MCGIIAYIGPRQARAILLDGLSRLEYRGYDSAGLATLSSGSGDLSIVRKAGRITELASLVGGQPLPPAQQGIGHTRWATHGPPTDENAHPHADATGRLVIVHNGVIENFQPLKRKLEAGGHQFASATDTEVLAHLIGNAWQQTDDPPERRLAAAVRKALSGIKGTFGIAVMHQDQPGVIVGARRGSPLVLGIGEGEMFLSSDAAALLPYTNKVVYLKDFDLVELRAGDFRMESLNHDRNAADYEIRELDFAPDAAERGEFPHFMLKEIHEQPQTVENAVRGRLNVEESSAQLGGLNMTPAELRDVERVIVLGCGTALHAGMVGAHMLEDMAGVAAETECAGEFRFKNRPLPRGTLFIAVSQSGETADTLGAMREARRRGFRCLGLCNQIASTIARESDGGTYMHAGPEIGVAATKSFVSQTAIFGLLALLLGRMRRMSAGTGGDIIQAYSRLPDQIRRILECEDKIKALAEKYAASRSMLFLGRQYHFPVALEAALKLKEISYIHAAGFAASELKHGVIALIEPETPTVILCPKDSLYEKNIGTMQEIKARGGPVIAVATEGDDGIYDHADDVIHVPRTLDMLQPVLSIIPLQLFAYRIATALGRDVDKPRNLAKSVTVE